MQQSPREALPRVVEGPPALSPTSRGRSAAPHFSLWLPIAAKVAAAALGAVILAVIGAKAGAHGPPAAFEPAPSATAPMVAAAFGVTLPSPSPDAPRDAGSTDPPIVEGESTPGSGLLADGRVVLNAASEAELTKLPGIGPSRARAILALRQHLTKFRAVEDLLRIKGIGRKMLRRLRPNVVLDRPAVDPRPSQAPPAVVSPATEESDATDP